MKTSVISQRPQRGAAIVEFALVALFFFTLLFGIMEYGRVMYLWNTVQEVTRHAARDAVVADFSNTSAMNTVRWNAIFRNSAGPLIAAGEITDASVVITYLNANMNTVDITGNCPARNISTCLTDPNANTCIRFVEARICQPGTECTSVNYSPMIGLFSFLNIPIPTSSVVMPAESLGFRPSSPAC